MTSCKHHSPEKNYEYYKQNFEPFDAVIVPGVPFRDTSWARVMKLRVYWAKYLYDTGVTKNIIFSGGAVYTPYSECEIMRLYALEMGIPDENIYLDSLAEHSTENVYYGYWVAEDNGFDCVALASDKYQANGLRSMVKKLNKMYGENMAVMPAIMDTSYTGPHPDLEIDPSSAYKSGDGYINITESQGKIYRIRGTMGQHIDWDNRPPVRIRDKDEIDVGSSE